MICNKIQRIILFNLNFTIYLWSLLLQIALLPFPLNKTNYSSLISVNLTLLFILRISQNKKKIPGNNFFGFVKTKPRNNRFVLLIYIVKQNVFTCYHSAPTNYSFKAKEDFERKSYNSVISIFSNFCIFFCYNWHFVGCLLAYIYRTG